jgi:hypothetical protein
MPIKNPNTPYERAYNAWSYGGGQQRGEPMPRARDFASEYEDEDRRRREEPAPYEEQYRRMDEAAPYSGRGGRGVWQGPQEPYQRAPPMGGLGTYDPRTSPPPPITDRRLPYTRPEVFNYGGMPGAGGARDEEQRRLAESPAVVQRAREYEQRRRRPRSGRTSLGALNRR